MPDKQSRLRKYLSYLSPSGAREARRPGAMQKAMPTVSASLPRPPPEEPSVSIDSLRDDSMMTEDEQRMLDAHLKGTRGKKQRRVAEYYASEYRSK